MNRKARTVLNIVVDVLIILSFLWVMFCLQTNFLNCDNDGWSLGWKSLKYFTNIGNLLLAFSSLVSLILHIAHKEKTRAFGILRVAAVVCSTIIMLVTYVTLSSRLGWHLCFAFPAYLFEHTLLPLFGFLQLFWLDEKVTLHWQDAFYSLILPSLYMLVWIIVLLILNLPEEIETDLSVVPYFFLAIHYQPVYMTLLYVFAGLSASFLLGWVFVLVNNKIKKRETVS